MNRKYIRYVCTAILCLLFFTAVSSCKYGLEDAFWRTNSVSVRSTSLADITGTFPADEDTDIGALLTRLNSRTDTYYTFLILTDVHFGADAVNQEMLTAYLDSLEEADRPLFCVMLGDATECGEASQFRDYKAFTDTLRETYNMPVFSILGNHDLYNNGSELFEKLIYPYRSFYRLQTEKTSYYFLDSANGTLGENQLNDLIDRMKQDQKKKIVFTHYPIYGNDILYFCMNNTMERALLITTFAENRVQYVFCGHYHKSRSFDFGNFREIGVRAYNAYKSWTMVKVRESTGEVSIETIAQ